MPKETAPFVRDHAWPSGITFLAALHPYIITITVRITPFTPPPASNNNSNNTATPSPLNRQAGRRAGGRVGGRLSVTTVTIVL